MCVKLSPWNSLARKSVANLGAPSGMSDIMPVDHVVKRRPRVVRAGNRVDRQRERDATPGPHEAGGGLDMLRRDVVERAAVVVRAPSAPVAELLEKLLELLAGNRLR